MGLRFALSILLHLRRKKPTPDLLKRSLATRSPLCELSGEDYHATCSTCSGGAGRTPHVVGGYCEWIGARYLRANTDGRPGPVGRKSPNSWGFEAQGRSQNRRVEFVKQ